MQYNQAITYEFIGGAERPLKFGTNQSHHFTELRGIELSEYGRILSEGMQDLGVIRDLLYSGLWAGAMSKGLQVDFNSFMVGDWIDEIGLETALNILTKALTGSENPNVKAQAKAPKMKKA